LAGGEASLESATELLPIEDPMRALVSWQPAAQQPGLLPDQAPAMRPQQQPQAPPQQQRGGGAGGRDDFSEQFLHMLQRENNGHLLLAAGKAGSHSTGTRPLAAE
jgi:hypothetical protein